MNDSGTHWGFFFEFRTQDELLVSNGKYIIVHWFTIATMLSLVRHDICLNFSTLCCVQHWLLNCCCKGLIFVGESNICS